LFGIFRRAAWFFRTGSVRLVPAEIQCLQTRLGSLCADPSGQSLDVVFPCFLHVLVQCTASDSSSGIHEFVKYPTAIQTARLEAVRVNTLCLSKVIPCPSVPKGMVACASLLVLSFSSSALSDVSEALLPLRRCRILRSSIAGGGPGQ